MLNRKKRNNKGFTLVELLVVIAIIGILAVVAVPTLFKQIDKARVADVNANVSSVKSAAMAYYADTAERPTSIAQLVSNGYLDSEPKKNELTYELGDAEEIRGEGDEATKVKVTKLKVSGIKDGMVSALESTYGTGSVTNKTLSVTILSDTVK